MPVSPTQVRAISGVRNDIPLNRFSIDSDNRQTPQLDLSACVNLDIDETGALQSRAGTKQVMTGAFHSLYTPFALSYGYVVKDGVLGILSHELVFTPIVPVFGRVCFAEIGNQVFWTDGAKTGRLVAETNTQWGVTPPTQISVRDTVGSAREGTYLCCMTYLRADGHESGASHVVSVKSTGGIEFFDIPISSNVDVDRVCLYVSHRNGEVPMLVARIPNGQTHAVISSLSPPHALPVRTLQRTCAMTGQCVASFLGYTLIASGSHLFFSQAFEPELFDQLSGFVTLGDVIQTISPVTTGVYVGTNKNTFWLDGTDPAQWHLQHVFAFGTVRGTESNLSNLRRDMMSRDSQQRVVSWMSKKGLCVGTEGGNVRNVTGGRYIPPNATEGASIFKIRNATPHVVTTLFY